MTIKGLKKKTAVAKKRQTLKFTVDCSIPVADNVLDAAGLVSVNLEVCVALSQWWQLFPRMNLHDSTHADFLVWHSREPAFPPPFFKFNFQEKFFHDRIKVDGKTGQLGELVTITREKSKITVTSDVQMSKRYLKVSVRDPFPGNSLAISHAYF